MLPCTHFGQPFILRLACLFPGHTKQTPGSRVLRAQPAPLLHERSLRLWPSRITPHVAHQCLTSPGHRGLHDRSSAHLWNFRGQGGYLSHLTLGAGREQSGHQGKAVPVLALVTWTALLSLRTICSMEECLLSYVFSVMTKRSQDRIKLPTLGQWSK